MSEPQSSGDVERVLDNIRRLVSSKPVDGPAPAERLMLTSDLRVPQGPEEAPKDAHATDSVTVGAPPKVDGPPADQSLEARIAQLETAVSSEQGFEPDGSEAQEPPLAGSFSDLTALFHEGELDAGEAGPTDPGTALSAEPETSIPTASGNDLASSEAWSFDTADEAERNSAEPDVKDAMHDTVAEPDETAPTDPSLQFRHTTPQPRVEADDDDTLMDEEMLRELVAEIVREELSGALGERITRNVKKMVRREIMRALSAREFD